MAAEWPAVPSVSGPDRLLSTAKFVPFGPGWLFPLYRLSLKIATLARREQVCSHSVVTSCPVLGLYRSVVHSMFKVKSKSTKVCLVLRIQMAKPNQ